MATVHLAEDLKHDRKVATEGESETNVSDSRTHYWTYTGVLP